MAIDKKALNELRKRIKANWDEYKEKEKSPLAQEILERASSQLVEEFILAKKEEKLSDLEVIEAFFEEGMLAVLYEYIERILAETANFKPTAEKLFNSLKVEYLRMLKEFGFSDEVLNYVKKRRSILKVRLETSYPGEIDIGQLVRKTWDLHVWLGRNYSRTLEARFVGLVGHEWGHFLEKFSDGRQDHERFAEFWGRKFCEYKNLNYNRYVRSWYVEERSFSAEHSAVLRDIMEALCLFFKGEGVVHYFVLTRWYLHSLAATAFDPEWKEHSERLNPFRRYLRPYSEKQIRDFVSKYLKKS